MRSRCLVVLYQAADVRYGACRVVSIEYPQLKLPVVEDQKKEDT